MYRHSGYVLGLLAVQAFSYVEFDNARRRATFGFRTPFAPKDPSRWDAYPMRVENHVLVADVPVAGRRVRLCPDTGGGPVPILNPADWKEIEPHVKVRRQKRSSYPAWEGFVPAVAYTLEELEVGNQWLRNAVVHVKTGSGPEAAHASTVGLGTFKHTTVVFDFKNMKLWVKKPGAAGPNAGRFSDRPPAPQPQAALHLLPLPPGEGRGEGARQVESIRSPSAPSPPLSPGGRGSEGPCVLPPTQPMKIAHAAGGAA